MCRELPLILLWINKTNKRFILGFRPLYYYLQSSIFILVGLILYYVFCQYDWYRECFVLVDEVCDNLSRNLYPKRYGLIVLANSVKEYVLCFLVSYTILGICYLCKYASNRKRTRHNQQQLLHHSNFHPLFVAIAFCSSVSLARFFVPILQVLFAPSARALSNERRLVTVSF